MADDTLTIQELRKALLTSAQREKLRAQDTDCKAHHVLVALAKENIYREIAHAMIPLCDDD